MAEPAEEDIERMRELMLGDRNDTFPVTVYARHALAAGVQLPPMPEPPKAEAERYYVDLIGRRYWLFDRQELGERSDDKVVAGEFNASEDAERVARLLNLDAKYEDGIEARVRKWQEEAKGWHDKAVEWKVAAGQAKADLEARVAEQPRVAELEAELAKLRRDYFGMRDLRDAHREQGERAEQELTEARAEASPTTVPPCSLCACGGYEPTDAPLPARQEGE